MSSPKNSYSSSSILLHWITAIAMFALFFTHEGENWSPMYEFHVSGGAILGIFILWRVIRRPFMGFPEKPSQPAVFNWISTIVIWGILLTTFVVTVTGYLLPWTLGKSLAIYDIFAIPSFMNGSYAIHEIVEQIHDIAGHVIVPLVLLHILGALKHLLIDRDGVMQRMIKGYKGGR